MATTMKIYCDGGSRGNPGPSASSFVVYKDDTIIHEDSKYLGENTNNVAEYTALVMALEWASQKAKGDVEIVLDSELVKKQMTGEYRIKNSTLQTLALKAKEYEKKIPGKVVYTHTLRAGNPRADYLVNDTLDKFNV